MVYHHLCVTSEPVDIIDVGQLGISNSGRGDPPIRRVAPSDSDSESIENLVTDRRQSLGSLAEHFHFTPDLTTDPTEWIMSPDNLGHAVAVEVAEIYYSKNTFNVAFGAAEYEKVLETFLSSDQFGLNIKPCDHIRNLIVCLRYEELENDLKKSDDEEDRQSLFMALHRSLGPLSVIKKNPRLKTEVKLKTQFHLDFDGRRMRSPRYDNVGNNHMFANIMEALWGPIYQFMLTGNALRVMHYNSFPLDSLPWSVKRKKIWKQELTSCFETAKPWHIVGAGSHTKMRMLIISQKAEHQYPRGYFPHHRPWDSISGYRVQQFWGLTGLWFPWWSNDTSQGKSVEDMSDDDENGNGDEAENTDQDMDDA